MIHRYIPNTDEDREEMLAELGLDSVQRLFDPIPTDLQIQGGLKIDEALTEDELVRKMSAMAAKNKNTDDHAIFLGAGAYDHFIPSVVKHLAFRSEFYTSYTPYQPELSQGMLQAIFEYQTMISQLTGMELVNASMYDGQTAAGEAATMSAAFTKRSKILVSGAVHPETIEVVKLYCHGQNLEVIEVPTADGITDLAALKDMITDEIAGLIVQYPNFYGGIEDLQAIGEMIHAVKGVFVVSANPIALGILKSPGELGADIVVGEGQALGNSLSFGGPYLGFFAVTSPFMRRIPGRIVGQTTDSEGRRGYVLTLQAREQHIRREKATSNICSNQALNALIAAIYLAAVGKEGLVELANTNAQKAHYLYEKLKGVKGIEMPYGAPFFNEFVIKLPLDVGEINEKLLSEKIIGGYDLGKVDIALEQHMLVAVTEKRTKAEIDKFVDVLEGMI